MISLVGDTQDEFDTTVGTELTEGEGEDESEGDDVIGDFENVDDDIGLEGDQVESLFPHLSFVCSYLTLSLLPPTTTARTSDRNLHLSIIIKTHGKSEEPLPSSFP